MEFRFHRKLYSDGLAASRLKSIQKKVKKGSPKLNLFLITFPIGAEGLLEVYWYPELLQPFYRKMKKEVFVVGVAYSREDAFSLIEKMVEDIGIVDCRIPLKEYFGEDEESWQY